MRKVWDLGNTTVRNPNRIREGLIVFAREFQGNIYGKKQESRFIEILRDEGVLETNACGELDWFGRKWRHVFVKLGFITDKFKNDIQDSLNKESKQLNLSGKLYELTPAGEMLIKATSDGAISDVFIRQLICLEIPSVIEPTFKQYRMKPFIFFLQVLMELKNIKESGLTKTEMAAYIQLFRNHDKNEVKKTVREILSYREKRKKLQGTGRVKLKEFDRAILKDKSQIGGVQYSTLIDYADTTIRYSKMTGLISFSGGTVNIRDSKIKLIRAIIEKEPKYLNEKSEVDYLLGFYKGAPLPTDNPSFALSEIDRITMQLIDLGKMLPDHLSQLTDKTDIKVLENERYKLLDILAQGEEDRFAFNQSNEKAIKEILEYLETLAGGNRSAMKEIVDPPSYLEWVVWRTFLAIDHIVSPISKTRRFPIDEDMFPRHTAPGGGPDMLFEFEEFLLVVEVTLTTSSRQEAAEGETVRRHVADIVKATGKQVYGLFVAPTIDSNTAETFRKESWYSKNDEEIKINILPITILQLRDMLTKYLKSSYMPEELLSILKACLKHRSENGPSWKGIIDKKINLWAKV